MITHKIPRIVTIWVILFWTLAVGAQTDTATTAFPDTLSETLIDMTPQETLILTEKRNPYKFKPTQLVIPGTLIGIGIIGTSNNWMRHRNKEIRDELQEHIKRKITIDNYTQYLPIAATYGLNLCGIKGKHDYVDLTIIFATAHILMSATVTTMKHFYKVERPDASEMNSFPSGHTATVFMQAELLRKEYNEVSPWIGYSGYAVAACTGYLRMHNNRHWLTDVITGAGIGILSTEAAYWLYPVIAKTFFRKRYLKNTFISPFVSQDGKGVSCAITF